MARPFVAPDPKDRSINEPSAIISATQVLGLYNQENPEDKKERIVPSVKSWYEARMRKEGWDTSVFHGSQCVLTAKIELKQREEDQS